MKRFMSQRFRHAWATSIAFALLLPVAFSAEVGGVCVGDCDGNGQVFIAEVQRCVNLNSDLSTLPCDNADQNGDGTVDDNEVELCVQSFLDEDNCPMVFTPAATETPTDTPEPAPTSTPTNTQVILPTSTPTNTVTNTSTATPTNTPTRTPTNTLSPTATNTPAVIGAHSCSFDNSSQVTISTQALSLPPFTANGAIEIDCGSIDSETGKAPCSCNVESFDPIEIIAIGFVCFTPGSACPTGEIDCDGGNALGVTMDSDHNIGTCTSNADCESQCQTHCSSLGYDYFASGCEGFCLGGSNDGNSCNLDADCPGGSCPGRNEPNQHDDICQCDCVGIGGPPSPAGTLQCNLSVNINVEAAAPCGNGDVTIAVGTRCIPLSSGTVTSQLHDTNNTAGVNFPNPAFMGTGSGIACTALADGTTTGLNLLGSVNFFDSTIGDLHTNQTFTCE